MKYQRILTAVYNSPWAILPCKLDEIRAFLHQRANGIPATQEQLEALQAARRDNTTMYGRVAVLPVFGVLAQRVGLMEESSGGVSADAIGYALDGLVADHQVKSIVLAFDSPGGSVYGIEELATKIRGYRDSKRIVAMADSIAASAAYWLAAQCTEVVVTPGGQVGSIGVIAAHTDVSKFEEMAGVKTTVVTSAPYKAEGIPEAPLSEEAFAEIQGKVNHYHGLFVGAVAKGRGINAGKVSSDFGQGRMVTAKEAVQRGMADRVSTMQELLGKLGASGGAAAEATHKPGLQARLAAARARAVQVECGET